MDWPLFDFGVACLMMGLGIGTDVAIATALRHKQLNCTKTILYWVLGVSLTHTLFPMLGYLLTYFSIQTLPAITPIVGLIAFYCIARFLWQELTDMAKGNNSSDDRHLLVTLGLILAVSWDALWSGPAKSAQVIGWPELLVWSSFLVVGMMVAIAALASLKLSKNLGLKINPAKSASLTYFGLWLQYAIVGYFGLLALLRYTLALEIEWWQILLISSVLIFICLEAIELFKRRNTLGSS